MREIKFKAWLPGIKKMTHTHTLEELMNWDTKPEDNGTAIWLQYTGLKDKNGKEIFEGDIIEIGHTAPPYLETVVFREGCFETAEDCDNICHVKHNDFIAVVGNIYEHNVNLYGVTLK